MSPPESLKDRDLAATLLYGLLFLFFLQLISEFVEAIYAFGLLGTSLPPEVASVLFLFSPLLLLLLPGLASGWAPVLLGELMLACRVVVPMLDTRGKMLVSGFGVACFLLLLPILLRKQGEGREENPVRSVRRAGGMPGADVLGGCLEAGAGADGRAQRRQARVERGLQQPDSRQDRGA